MIILEQIGQGTAHALHDSCVRREWRTTLIRLAASEPNSACLTRPAACHAKHVTKRKRSYPWWVWALLWLGSIASLLVFAEILSHFTGRPQDWAVSAPFAVLSSTGSVGGAVYGSRRKSRR
jgi:hypothetical protein